MGYAVRNDGLGWHAVDSSTDCSINEDYYDVLPPPTTAQQAAQIWSAYQSTAQSALSANDMVAIRCAKAGVAYPAEWNTYDVALRAIIRATSGDPSKPLPTKPIYPSGT